MRVTDMVRHSLIDRFRQRLVRLGRRSFFGAVLRRNTNDRKVGASLCAAWLVRLAALVNDATRPLGRLIDGMLAQSVLVQKGMDAARALERWFCASMLCALGQRLFEVPLSFAGMKLYQWFVFLLVFTAPILPTMVCAGLAVLCALLLLLDLLRKGAQAKHIEAPGFFVLFLMAVFGFYAVFSLTPASSLRIFVLYTAFMMMFFILIRSVDTKLRLQQIGLLMVLSGLLVSLIGIYQRFFGDNTGHAWLDDEMFDSITIRVYSTLENPNVLGEYLLLVMPVCAAFLWTRKELLSRLFYGGALGVMAMCMIFTQSRGCWLGLLLSVAVFAVLVDWRLVLLGIAGLFLAPIVMPESIVTRFTSIGNVNDSSTSYRLYIWLGTINMLKDFGIYGIGLGSDAFNKIYPFYSYSTIKAPHSHNIYLQLLCETGVVGLGAFLLGVLTAVKKMFLTVVSGRKSFPKVLSASVIAAMAGFMLQGAFDYTWYNYRVFLIFWMVLALGLAARRVKDEQADTRHQ